MAPADAMRSTLPPRLNRVALPLLAALLWPATLEAQVELRGRLLTEAGAPIPGITVTLVSVGYSVRSDSSGRFVLSGARGATLKLMFSGPGFRGDSASVTLARSTMEREFKLASADTPLPEANPSTTAVRGRVTDDSGTPLSYANVQVNYAQRFVADDSGRFEMPYPVNGPSTLFVRRIGFEPAEVRLTSRPDTALRITLKAIPAQLKEVTVTAASAYRSLDLHGFYRRMREAARGASTGWFITPEDIERRKATNTTQMADGFPTVRVSKSGLGPMWDRILGSQNCPMKVYVDNILITRRGDDFVNQLVPIGHVAAMEIYPRAIGAPPQYLTGSTGTCGIVLIWTK